MILTLAQASHSLQPTQGTLVGLFQDVSCYIYVAAIENTEQRLKFISICNAGFSIKKTLYIPFSHFDCQLLNEI